MRILAVVRHPCGGIRTYLRYVYGRLPSSYQITLLTVQHPEVKVLREDLAERVKILGRVPQRRAFWSLAQAAYRQLKRGEFDLVHSHGFTAGAAVVLVNHGRRVPHVVTSHDVLRRDHFAGAAGPVKAFMLTQLLGQADVIQSVSGDAQANLESYLPRLPERCILTTSLNGIDVDQFAHGNGNRHTLRAELGYDASTLLIGFLGRLMPQKGFDTLIEAVCMLAPRPAFRIVVSGHGGLLREYQQQTRVLGLDAFFHWRGFAADAAPLIRSLDAIVMPSRWEACGVLAMEALVAGCPLIASNCAGLREVIVGSPAVPVPPDDAAALANAITYALAYPAEVKAMARAYMPIARRRFDVQRVATDLEALFAHLTARRQSGD